MPTATAPNGSKASTLPKKASQRSKKSRIVRRRGRAQTESDDEIEREARSDTDTDDQSSLGSESDSETASDDEHHAGIVTPSTTQSPPPLDINGSSSAVKRDPVVNGSSVPFVQTTDWAQLVADENNEGGGDLPVIDFADMHAHAIPESRPAPRSKKAQKQVKKGSVNRAAAEPTATADEHPEEKQTEVVDEPVASTSQATSTEPVPRGRSQSARQAYQERLQQDPAFVPRVGEFWGHDDRLLDKDLRSLSGWWRGRWHNRGRGRGAFNMRGRGGRGFFPGRVQPQESHEDAGEPSSPPAEVPPIDRAWTHDGFEEMKRREDQRRAEVQSLASQRGAAFRGRGGFVPVRGRGGLARGGHTASPTASNGAFRADSHTDVPSQRPWFAMKPEKVWTKHADLFLYTDAALRPRPGQGAGVRVKLPGRPAQVLRSQKHMYHKASLSGSSGVKANSSTSLPAEDADRQFVVRFPSQPEKRVHTAPKATGVAPPQPKTQPGESELSIEEVFTVRPHAVPSHVPLDIPISTDSNRSPVASEQPSLADSASPLPDASALPDPATRKQLEQLGLGLNSEGDLNAPPSAVIEETLLRHPTTEGDMPAPDSPTDHSIPPGPSLHPLQTSFSPVPPTSPPYGSPYSYGPPMPPGIAMNHQGYPYEVATGRLVYLSHPAPPPMFTPRPMIHSYMGTPPPGMPFVPGHMSHPSQEFTPHAHTPVNGFIDPATGVPIFAPARQNSRIEIRAPDDRTDGHAVKPTHRPSGLRSSVSEVDSPAAQGDVNAPAAPAQSPPHAAPLQPVENPPMMAYAPYPHQYYYPDPNAYSAYMDMSPQMHYELYPPHDQGVHQPVIYY
ncbi:hypothetical protein BDW22DRAFT_1485845 [Trametopsis cervina]|nr:hypothetical protein BDW22DRAFT_1485845 [Trametopsis cervina]